MRMQCYCTVDPLLRVPTAAVYCTVIELLFVSLYYSSTYLVTW